MGERIPLTKAVEYLLEECRMVLPGIQALFGFQLIVVFSSTFTERLSPGEQRIHVAAIVLIVVAIALIMTPAAYHRQRGAREITESFVTLSSRLLLMAMAPLALGICLDSYLVVRVIVGRGVGAVVAAGLLSLFALSWGLLPRARSLGLLLTHRK